ncbi:hypothetical protein HIM_03661 [Hirsutella minnesotensis 3608]|uniref:CENP-V/GFA domain-containing protein n=1 Tax=Hirsutella minnesotensis 3608 TaxID=1043627 RepID=A0A0F8A6B4_9HYPO|nr:hypothetical protein HIM_03661 [Hirsutella minnesotensis 3608]
MATDTATRRTYRGNCHCGAFVYEVDMPEIKSACDCNCSICRKKGYLSILVGADDEYRAIKWSEEDLTEYTFGPKNYVHQFCSRCATPVTGYCPNAPPGRQRALIVRAIQGLNTWSLDKVIFDGAALGNRYESPEYKGSLPPAVEGSKLYTGSCHCGKLGIAVMSKPLDETYSDRVVDCNCSICERNGCRWIYPPSGAVILSGNEADMGRYSFGRHMLCKTFCKTCGVCMTNGPNPQMPEVEDNEENRATKNWLASYSPVNLRVLDGVDMSRLKPTQVDGAGKMDPQYENP